ncbi:MAG: response regulator, partial [Candidatus Aminicenantales bacterium]
MSPEPTSDKAAALNILVVDDEANVRRVLSVALETDGHRVVGVGNVADALAENSRQSFDLAFIDLRLGTDDGLDLIPALLAAAPWIKVIVITAYASIDTAVEAMRRGAADYIPKPFTPAQIRLAMSKVFTLRAMEQKLAALQEDLGRARPETDFSSSEPAMQRAIALARQAAGSEATILLCGENGTGKTVLARAIHAWSRRAD